MGIVRSALRHLASAPGFTIVAVLSLTLGIGPTTAIFSLIDELLLRSLPVAKPDELVLLRVQQGVRGRMSHAGEGQGGVDPVTGREIATPLSLAICRAAAGDARAGRLISSRRRRSRAST